MTNIDKYNPGSFCWVELATTDQFAASSFYGALFGWSVNNIPMGPNEFYSMYQLHGRELGAACTLRPEERAQGVPAHWRLYIAVESADATAARAAQLGAKVLAPAFDVMDVGRMAVLQDPTGAHFSIWQSKRDSVNAISGVDGTLCWADLNTPDPERARKFYTDLFGWKITDDTDDDPPSGYVHIQNGEDFIGGIAPVRPNAPRMPAHWMAYFQVSDCDATAAKAKEHGARFYMEPTTMENVGRFAIVADPQGAAFAIFQSARK
jgi:predicted enzyme related to lactoylglutathione lyase